MRCVASQGGAIHVTDSSLSLNSLRFATNYALEGGSIYTTNSNFEMVSSTFDYGGDESSNVAQFVYSRVTVSHQGYAIYIKCVGSSLQIFDTPLHNLIADCTDCLTSPNVQSHCHGSFDSKQQIAPQSNNSYISRYQQHQKHQQPQHHTTTLSDKNDCKDDTNDFIHKSNGEWKLKVCNGCHPRFPSIDGELCCSSPIESWITSPEINNLVHHNDNLDSATYPVTGSLSAYVSGNITSQYHFLLQATNMGVAVIINNVIMFNSYYPTNKIKSERSMILSNNQDHLVVILFFSLRSEPTNMSLKWRRSQSLSYQPILSSYPRLKIPSPSQHPPTDNSESPSLPSSASQPSSSFFSSSLKLSVCGDGVCNEVPESCIQDCYDHLLAQCPYQYKPSSSDPKTYESSDFAGALSRNQYLNSLPGINIMSHGVDLVTLKEVTSAIFSLGLNAQMVFKCEFDTNSQSFSSTTHMAYERSFQAGFSSSVQASGGNFFLRAAMSASVAASYSSDSSNTQDSTITGSVASTSFQCQISKVYMNKPTFHPKFMKDVAKAHTIELMKAVIKKYGVLYKVSAILGGELSQTTTISSTVTETESAQSVSASLAVSFSASVSSKLFNSGGSASMAASATSQTNKEKQQTFDSNSEKSQLKIIGGSPGSYGANVDNPLESWVGTIDLVPYPIKSRMALVSDIIPENWYISKDTHLKTLWIQAQEELYKGLFNEKANPFFPKELTDNMDKRESVFFRAALDDEKDLTMTFAFDNNSTTRPAISIETTVLPRQIDIFDVITSRLYNWMYFPNSSTPTESVYSPVDPPAPNTVILKIGNPVLSSKENLTAGILDQIKIKITLIGTVLTNTVTFIPHAATNTEISINFPSYPGNILGLSFKILTSNLNYNDNITFSVDQFLITQECPDRSNITTDCVHSSYKSLYFGYTRAYVNPCPDSKCSPYSFNNLDHRSMFVPAEPIGLSDSLFYK
eukprot:gene18747-22420_t